jgi:hypothetical protein
MELNGIRRFALSALLACATAAAAAATPEPSPPTSPTEQSQAEIDALLANDTAVLFDTGRNGLEQFAQRWESDRERRRAEGAKRTPSVPEPMRRAWTLLLDDEGTEVLVREWHAALVDGPDGALAGKVSVGIAGLFGAAIAAPDVEPGERIALIDAMRAAQAWAMTVDWSDPERLRTAVAALAKAVRATDVDSPDAVADLPFEDAVAHFDGFLAAGKSMALAYDLDVDAILRSYRVREVMRDGDEATLEERFTLFGVSVPVRSTVVWHDGKWVPPAYVEAEEELAHGGTSEDAVTTEVRETVIFREPSTPSVGECSPDAPAPSED